MKDLSILSLNVFILGLELITNRLKYTIYTYVHEKDFHGLNTIRCNWDFAKANDV